MICGCDANHTYAYKAFQKDFTFLPCPPAIPLNQLLSFLGLCNSLIMKKITIIFKSIMQSNDFFLF